MDRGQQWLYFVADGQTELSKKLAQQLQDMMAVARQFVRQKKSIKELFTYERSPPGQFYPICHSLVQYLIHTNAESFVGMINDIKGGLEGRRALAKHYKGLNTNTLELAWRAWVAKTFLPD